MTVTITIQRAQVLADMKVTSHAEVASIEDAKARYKAEAGTEKNQQLHQCIVDAVADAESILRPFISGAATASADDAYSSTGDFTFTLEVTPRKAAGLAAPLARALHKFIVNVALSSFYRGVNQPGLAAAHDGARARDTQAIENLIYHRAAPSQS